jgi:DNA-binding NarL/FixJ family response regulator
LFCREKKKMSKPLDILIADDHEIVREGLRTILERHVDWTVCGEAATGTKAVSEAVRLQPDVILMDINMPELNGLVATSQIMEKVPTTKILILSAHESERLIRQMLSSGARGYMVKTDAGRDVVMAVEAIASGRLFFAASISNVLLTDYQKRSRGEETIGDTTMTYLTPRERQILQLLAEGNTNKEVAAHIGTSVKTVENQRGKLMTKLGLNSLADLVRYAIQNEILQK